jgi:RND family efflux transporter MFP subunit
MKKYTTMWLLLFCSLGCEEPEVAPRDVVRPVKILEVTSDGRLGKAEYPGRVAAADEADLSFEVPGQITELKVKEGDTVKKGQVLARLDAEKYRAQLELTQAKERAAKSDYERHQQLFAQNATTAQELDFAKRNFEIAAAQTKLTQKSTKDTVLKAPFSGMIAKVNADNFQSVQAKQPVMFLHDANKNGLEVKIDIPERDLAGAEKGLTLKQRTEQMQPKVVISGVGGKEFPAFFKEVSTVADPTTRTFQITLGFAPQDDIVIAPGMTARGILEWPKVKGAEAKILIPTRALVAGHDNKEAQVWVIDTKTMTAKGTPVKLGKLTEDQVEVKEGLKPGVSIAVSGVQQLRDGMKVSRYVMKNY